MKYKHFFAILCIIAITLTSCGEKQVPNKPEKQETQEEEVQNKKEKTEVIHEVDMDEVVEGLRETAQNLGLYDNLLVDEKAIKDAFFAEHGYHYGEKWRLTGIMKEEPTWNATCVLLSEKYQNEKGSYGSWTEEFVCSDSENRHIFVQPGTKVVLEGTLSEQGSLDECRFISPNIENPEFIPNVSEVLQKMEQTQTVIGTIQDIQLVGLTDEQREELDFENNYYDLARTTSHVGTLTDGENSIRFYVSQNNNENLQPGDKIAVRGKVSQQEEELFIYCGDAVYRF